LLKTTKRIKQNSLKGNEKTMKRSKFIGILFAVALCAVLVAILVGCDTNGVDYEYDYRVTFDYNVDNLGVATNCETQFLGVNEGSKIVEPGSLGDSMFTKYTVKDYYNEGWYTAVLDSEGNPQKDADGNILLDTKWNFDTDVVRKDMTLYANFRKNPTLTVIVEGGTNITVNREPGTVYNKPVASSSKPQRPGYTFIDYYTDDTYTTKFGFPYTFTEQNAECYALMLEGDWVTVTNTNSFLKALLGGQNMYLDVPSKQLDFTGRLLDSYIGLNYNGIIYGNGCVVKNMNIDVTYGRTISNYSLFGNLGENTVIKDISFENVSFKLNVNTLATSDLKAALFANNIAAGAVFENVTFKDCSLTYTGNTYYTIDTYGYFVSSETEYGCFDETQLTVTNSMNVIPREEA